jgi:hypothetical protein
MKITILLLALLAPLAGHALSLPLGAGQTPPAPSPAPVPVVHLDGILERRVAIGGETTGWVLRYGDKQRIDLLLPVEAFAWIQEGMWVGVKGVYSTKRFPERGEVPVFIVHEIHQVQT